MTVVMGDVGLGSRHRVTMAMLSFLLLLLAVGCCCSSEFVSFVAQPFMLLLCLRSGARVCSHAGVLPTHECVQHPTNNGRMCL